MAFRTKKISQMEPKGSNLASTDLLEISQLVSGSYVTKSITGAQIAASAPAAAWGTITGTLSTQTDLQNALNAKEPTITAGTTSQYYRGDKSFQTLDKNAVGLSNVDNTSDANKPVSTATQTALNAKVTGNTAITGATKTKVTYDSKGLVTAGADATTADIADSLNKRYVTDANLTVIGNTSGTNTGDQTLVGLGGVPTTRTLTINGTTQDLSADRTFTVSTGITIGTTAITSGTNGRFLFDDAGVVSETNGAFWDKVNGRWGIGTSSPTQDITVSKTLDGIASISILNSSGGTTASSRFYLGSTNTQVAKLGSNYTTGSILKSGDLFLYNQTVGNITFWNNLSTGNINFTTGSGTTAQVTIASTGNVLINTTTDAGYKLDVNGTARVVGSMLVQGMTVGLGGGAVANSVAIGKEALQNNTIYQNCAVGYRALYNNTGGDNTAVGAFYAMFANTTGGRNTAIGTYALNGNTTGQWNSALGYNTSSGNFDGSVILGYGAGATASNQFVVGSSAVNAGAVTSEVNASTQVWNVVINGVARKILLA